MAADTNVNIFYFDAVNATKLFNFKTKITGQTGSNDRKDVKIMVLLKYMSNFWRTYEKS